MLPAALRLASAQSYPARPVRLIVGFSPGGAADIVARLMTQWLREGLGQQFVVENKPGAGTNIATENVVHARPDGYTLLYCTSSNAINATLYEKLNFNFTSDVAPVASIMRAPLVMVINPSLPARTVSEFIAYAKSKPDSISMASAGNGTPGHVAGEMFKMLTGINMVHVPYRGGAPALTDLLGGQVQVYFSVLPDSMEHIRAGQLRALAVTSETRSKALPDVPPMRDFVPGYEADAWGGIGAPRGTPADIVERLNGAINAALADPMVQTRIEELGGVPMPMTPAEFGRFIVAQTEKWAKVVSFSGAKAR